MIAASAQVSGLLLGIVFNQVGQLFVDVTAREGVSFTHHAPDHDTDELYMGAGGAWGDYNNDGDIDLYVCDQEGPNKLFVNWLGDSGFGEKAAEWGIDAPDATSTGALWGDYDNDGDQDLYVLNRGANIMFRNDGYGGPYQWIFTDVTDELGVGGFGRSSAAVYGDYDNDGWLDLYVAVHHYPYTKPDSLAEGDDPMNADRLYHNVAGVNGGRTFVDVAPDIFGEQILNTSIAHSAGFFDYDNDRDLDLYIVNEIFPFAGLLPTQLWRNDGSDGAGGWKFTEVSLAKGCQRSSHPMGLAIGDYNNDGWLDFAMSDNGANMLFQNQGGTFLDVADQAKVARLWVPGKEGETVQFGWGLIWFDFDLNGYEDLFVATGIFPDALVQPDPLFKNNGNPLDNTFTDVTEESGSDDLSSGRTVIKADYDRDGDEDFYVITHRGEAHLYRNEQVGGDYFIVELRGTTSNRDAIGARVKITANGIDQYRMVQSGSTTGGSHELALFFGVTGATKVDSVVVDWPSGFTTTLTDQAINTKLLIEEVAPAVQSIHILGPNTVGNDSTNLYTAIATYEDATEVNVTDETVWSVDPTTYGSFNSPGAFTAFGLASGEQQTVVIKVVYESFEATATVEIVDSSVVDIEPPTVSIAEPDGGANFTTSEATVELSGTVSDNFGVVSVVWSDDHGRSGPCQGLSSWTTGPIALVEGPNEITVSAMDSSGLSGSTSIAVTYAIDPPTSEPPPVDIPDPIDDLPLPDDPQDPSAQPAPDPDTPSDDDDNTTPIDDAIEPLDAAPPSEPEPPAGDPFVDDSSDTTTDQSQSSGNRSAGGSSCGALGLIGLPFSFFGLCILRRDTPLYRRPGCDF